MSLPIILIITSFPPRKCGIATYSQDLIKAIEDKYESSFIIKVCALKKKGTSLEYPDQVGYILNTWDEKEYVNLALELNENELIEVIYLQHEFGLYEGVYGAYLISFLKHIKKPVITTFHTVLSNPDMQRKTILQQIAFYSASVIVMTKHSSKILSMEYDIAPSKVTIIPHGTHLIKPVAKSSQNGFPFEHKKILATFGLLSEGKSIETALSALPKIIEKFPNIIYLIIGKTHPEVIKNEGEKYRDFLKEKVRQLGIEKEVLFINKYLSLDILLEYLQRTDIYLFTSKDPQQAVSGTLAYALSAGCPVVSTPIPHALELLDGAGLNFDFNNNDQLADAVILLLSNNSLMYEMHMSAIHRISPTAWQNAAMAHLQIAYKLDKLIDTQIAYKTPPILLDHIKRMTTPRGMIQFAIVADPDNSSGYTLDDNARALIAVAKHFDLTGKFDDLHLIHIYLNFILFCQQEDGSFLNYVSFEEQFGIKNQTINLEDSNGRAIWALGEYLSLGLLIDYHLQIQIEEAFVKSLPIVENFQSPRAIAFAI
ncbi:MAG: glycosyltransferase [Bacteroidota bacterium]